MAGMGGVAANATGLGWSPDPTMTKQEALTRWRHLPPNQNPLDHMTPIPPSAKGSRYGACGIRIDGNPRFVDAVLSRLLPLLEGEGDYTRLECSRSRVDGSGLGKKLENKDDAAEVVYLRLYERGGQG